MDGQLSQLGQGKANAALELLKQALDLLDELDAPAEIAAHVDLAIHRLAETLALRAGGRPA